MKLLVDTPRGVQELLDIGPGGSYAFPERVLWDERVGGPLPEIELGAMVRQGGQLVVDEARRAQHAAALVKVPQEVTMRQARQALILEDLDGAVQTLLDGIPGKQGKLARAEWERSQTVQRNRPLVLQMWAALGKTPAELDALFIKASQLP